MLISHTATFNKDTTGGVAMSPSSPPRKRRKLSEDTSQNAEVVISEPSNTTGPREDKAPTPSRFKSLSRPITPPLSRRSKQRATSSSEEQEPKHLLHSVSSPAPGTTPHQHDDRNPRSSSFPSPFQLTRIKDLSPAENVDTVSLRDILGDPMIKECWNFNYLFNLHFVMEHFDPDIRNLVKLNVVHGFWKRDDERRLSLEEQATHYPAENIKLISAYMPNPFGTHHTKMLILIRHDDLAQVVIHTANMIERDWRNMTQAVWRSPLLPLLPENQFQSESGTQPQSEQKNPSAIGTGKRFKVDLMRYLSAYASRLKDLRSQLIPYDFGAIHAAFIGSTPSREKPSEAQPDLRTSFGWPGLREILSNVPVSSSTTPATSSSKTPPSRPHIVIQISSIATLGQTPTWLNNFHSVLSTHSSFIPKPTFPPQPPAKPAKPKLSIIFPTPAEMRASLDGYASGDSIHTRLQSAAQQKQLQYLHPIFCHWRSSSSLSTSSSKAEKSEGMFKALRGPAAPHIKTYIRFSAPFSLDEKLPDEDKGREGTAEGGKEGNRSKDIAIDWAMITSANLSKQAWGDVENKNGEVWVQSWEAGVVVWPALFKEGTEMVPVFGKDGCEERSVDEKGGVSGGGKGKGKVALRMPYNLPLERYGEDEEPWCATMAYEEPDWMGRRWEGY
ncbi:phospholipase D/nuclease [Sporormia fimetaria CBS 119925]|uniref:Phospholipase D/nuclease n=1 Tax=Sporormia fimetaria CBS 119925 TaxID=1340428 RepID=A0A6A6V9W4_9PLEO|nr:phospholipase D/nuclease [Sporormia fimetaria CBS 119925]